MKLEDFFHNIVGLPDVISSSIEHHEVPPIIIDALRWDEKLPESILETDLRLLKKEEFYEVNEYTIFAEEAQCTVRWAFVDSQNDSQCFVLDHEEPVGVYEEVFVMSEVVVAMVIKNILSSNVLEHFRYETLSANQLEPILSAVPPVGGILDLKAIVHNGVACMLEIGDELFVNAASQSKDKLDSFIELTKTIGGRTR